MWLPWAGCGIPWRPLKLDAVHYEPDIHKRRSTRLDGYNYSHSGAYFFTIVTQNRCCLFGNVESDEMRQNTAGNMLNQTWRSLPIRFPSVILDSFIVMPNHVHGILIINQPLDRTAQLQTPSRPNHDGSNAPKLPTEPELGDVIGAFKSITTVEYTRAVRNSEWPPFQKRLWQRNYYDRIIRNAHELNLTRRYIAENPLKWHLDRENPENQT